MNKQLHFYKDRPLFGLDIGHASLKVMQLETAKKITEILGYGVASFDTKAIVNGVIVDPNTIGTAMKKLFKDGLVGVITTRRVALAIPGHQTFARSIQLPRLSSEELREAVQLEVEQYVPMPLQELYLDYMVTSQTKDTSELFVIAVPKKIVDSYLALAQMLRLEVILVEPTMTACARFFARNAHDDIPTVIIDFGALTADISIFHGTVLTTSTVPSGGLIFTEGISSKLQVDQKKAGRIKVKHGLDLSNYQADIGKALEPALQKVITGVRRMLRYYEERYGGKHPISQVVLLGGGANMPGLSTYLTNELKLAVRTHNDPWGLFEHPFVHPPKEADRLMYSTVAGLALLNPKEVFKND